MPPASVSAHRWFSCWGLNVTVPPTLSTPVPATEAVITTGLKLRSVPSVRFNACSR